MPIDQETGFHSLKKRFPFLRLTEATSICLSPFSVIAATLGWLMLIMLFGMTDRVLLPDTSNLPYRQVDSWYQPQSSSHGFPTLVTRSLAGPMSTTVVPTWTLLSAKVDWSTRFNALAKLALAVVIWSAVALFLCRRAATQISCREDSTLKSAIEFTRRVWITAFVAILIPLTAVLLLLIAIVLWGIPGRIPFLGEYWLFVTSPLVLIGGIATAILLLATAAGWPLMVAAAATDDSDSFGCLSRAFSGISSRLWYLMGLALFAIVVGFVFMTLMTLIGDLAIWCTLSLAGIGAGTLHVRNSLHSPVVQMTYQIVQGIGISYFWTAATVLYLILRNDIDGFPIDQIVSDEPPAARDPLPVVGIPATDSQSNKKTDLPSDQV